MKDFEKLCQLILIEEFKSCLLNNLKTYIDKEKAESLQQAMMIVDDYSLIHMSGSYNKLPNSDATHHNFPTGDPKSAGNSNDSPRNLRSGMSGGPIEVFKECYTDKFLSYFCFTCYVEAP